MSAAENRAVFLSYASQDAEAARRICEALRGADVEVWFDQSELVGGDAWDAKIRRQINECALFVPVISASTQARLEGYFRLEWKLAAQRTHTMAEEKTFLLPVVIDATRDAEVKVPAEFKAVQWTRLPAGETTAAFVARVKTLLGGSTVGGALRPDNSSAPAESGPKAPPTTIHRTRWMVPAILGLAALVALGFWQPWKTNPPPAPSPISQLPSPAMAPAAASVAVLAFANMSADKDTEYFSDGVSEELLNVLAKLSGLKVSARTSAFFYKGKQVPIKQVAQELGVAYVVEGSVRKSGDRVRITAQLIKADDGFQVWSQPFDRELKYIFAVQDEIAGLIAKSLSLKLGLAPAASPRATAHSPSEVEA
ncbi:MAG: TIR domain-containing protein [Opitutaceae bacterium]